MNDKVQLSISELVAILYLALPVLVFFLFFTRIELAVPSSAYIIYVAACLVSKVSVSFKKKDFIKLGYFIVFSACLLILSGSGRFLYSNGDWIKHFAIVNFLADHNWPAKEIMSDGSSEVLRYYIGWYLVPAALLKVFSLSMQDFFISLWSIIGLATFFTLFTKSVSDKVSIVLMPVLFVLFSGMDIIGTAINGTWNPEMHLEWWPGWMQYPSMLSAFFWVPQHAVSGWLTVALFLRFYNDEYKCKWLLFVSSCVLLSSPFIAIGLIPFGIALAFKYGIKPFLFNRYSIPSVLLLALPIGIYLSSGTAGIPHGFIWNRFCPVGAQYCFSMKSYFLVMCLEVIPFAFLLLLAEKKWSGFTIASFVFLLILPVYQMGAYNDLVMRASLPALTFFAMMTARVILNARRSVSIPLLVIFIIGVGTPGGEIARAVTKNNFISENTRFDQMPDFKELRTQYFSPDNVYVIKKN